MTESPLKEKLNKAFIENERDQKELVVAIDKWTTSWDRSCKLIAKKIQEIE